MKSPIHSLALAVALLLPMIGEAASQPPAPAAITTTDVRIPVEELKLLVKPLVVDELSVEADAWFRLVKAKTREIVAAQLGVRKTNEAIDAAANEDTDAAADAVRDAAALVDEAAEQAKTEQEAVGAAPEEDADLAGEVQEQAQADAPTEDDDAEDAAGAVKGSLLDSLAVLRTQQTALIDRLEVVLNSLERKGGEVDSYRNYITAISGIEVDVRDTTATWATVRGWLVSEEGGQRWAWNLGQFLVAVVLTWLASTALGGLVRKAVGVGSRNRVSKLAQDVIVRTLKTTVWIIGIVLAISILEVDITPMLAAIGAAGLVVGLALQGTLSNVASGVMILLNRPFDVGDVVSAGGVTGTISEMSLVATIFRTFDNQTVIVPNNEIWGQVITNITANKTRRVDLTFGVGYSDDLDTAERIIREVVEQHELVLADPAPVIKVHELGDSSVNFICRPWCKTGDYWAVYWDVIRSVKARFDAEGISIPFPQRDVHVHYTNTPPERPAT